METQTRIAKQKGLSLDLSLDLVEINKRWALLSRPLNPKDDANVIDFNFEVDNILQISPPYHSDQHNHDDDKKKTAAAAAAQSLDIYGKNGAAYYPPPLPVEESTASKRRGRPPKGNLHKRKKKGAASDSEDRLTWQIVGIETDRSQIRESCSAKRASQRRQRSSRSKPTLDLNHRPFICE